MVHINRLVCLLSLNVDVGFIFFSLFKNLSITFYSTSAISFIVPLNAIPGAYNVQVVNIYNDNFSPSVNQSYAGNPNFSNSQTYTLTCASTHDCPCILCTITLGFRASVCISTQI
jgi:hypothetical protein